VVVSLCSVAHAVEFGARLEGGVSLPVSVPHSEVFAPGPEATATAELGVHRLLDLEVQLGWTRLPAKTDGAAGSALFVGLGLRGRAPIVRQALEGWLEGIGHFNRTGDVSIGSISGAVGLTWRPTPVFGVGPFARVLHVFAPAAPAGYAAAPATLVMFGLAVELGNPIAVEEAPAVGPAPVDVPPAPPPPPVDADGDGVVDPSDACPTVKGDPARRGCPRVDTDADGLEDDTDACPQKAGPASNGGCPEYRQLRVTQSRLELNQKIFFAFGKNTILSRSFELLDEVGEALADHPRLCVQIEGHTDSVGGADSNRALSASRAQAVAEYLAKRGVASERLRPRGFGPDQPLESNATPEGRERNRRVEFVIVQCEVRP